MADRYVALVTGASSGIGEATARRLARESDIYLVLAARRADRLRELAAELGAERVTVIAVDLVERGAVERVRAQVERELGALHLLVNNAGAAWRGRFADTGWPGLERHMRLNFEAPARLTEALLPLLRASAEQAAREEGPAALRGRRVAIVNVASTASRVARPGSGGYSASKSALAGWTDALHAEEAAHGVHVGLVLPGFVRTEGFPAAELVAKATTRWLVSEPERVAEAIWQAGPGARAERYVPRGYWVFAALRLLAPGLMRRLVAGGGMTTATRHGGVDDAARQNII